MAHNGDQLTLHQGNRGPYGRRGDDSRCGTDAPHGHRGDENSHGRRGDNNQRGNDNAHGRSFRPNRQCCPYLPDVICAACKWRGHPASSCDMLAIALFVDHHKQQLLEQEKSTIEETWIARWKDKVGQPTRMPQ